MTRAFITGVAGFVGRHLSSHLADSGWSVSGQDLLPAAGFPSFYQADIRDREKLQLAVKESAPDVIFHLAGVLKSQQVERFYELHVLGTVALLDAVIEAGLRPLIVVASSSAVYGTGMGARPITENFKPRPATHYAVSKLAQEAVAMRYFIAFNVPVTIVRTFNLLGPGLSADMACSAFAWQIALAERDGKRSISTGGLNAKRDFVDVRDAVRAYRLIASNGKPGEVYNVCSGRAVEIRKCLDVLLKQARMKVEAKLDAARLQSNDIPVQIGSAQKLRRVTGWRPQVSFKQSLLDMLDDWRQKVQSGMER